jgi:hypothetical protein
MPQLHGYKEHDTAGRYHEAQLALCVVHPEKIVEFGNDGGFGTNQVKPHGLETVQL